MTRLCAVAGCARRLRADNASGVCNPHKRLRSRCARCGQRADTRFRHCRRCHMLIREAGKHHRPCAAPGCPAMTRSVFGYCRDHYRRVGVCVVDGCGAPTSAWNRSGCCPAHRSLARKLLQCEKDRDL